MELVCGRGDYWVALDRLIDDRVTSAKREYSAASASARLLGSLAGLEACRTCDPRELIALLARARSQLSAFSGVEEFDGYQYLRQRATEIQWVCDVMHVCSDERSADAVA